MNDICDVPGLRVGHASRVGDGWLSGVTVVLPPPEGAVAGVDVRGGGPGTRETDLLDPRNLVERVHAVVLAGGSAFGLAAADGVQRTLLAGGVGFRLRPEDPAGNVVPIVPAAVLFDLGRGGAWGNTPDAALGAEACRAAGPGPVEQGTVGAGTGARAAGLKGGVGSASAVLSTGATVGAIVAVNAVGSVLDPATGELWAARYCHQDDLPDERIVPPGRVPVLEPAAGGVLATTIGVIATDVTLTKAQCAKLAGLGHDGLARAIRPVHTMLDGDTLFALATGERPPPELAELQELLLVAGDCVTRSVARGIVAATGVTTPDGPLPAWSDLVGTG